jgi:hypothetical protein
MASKEANTIRFAVGDKNDVRSSIWRLWAKGNDLYLATRSQAKIVKISFHQSGINRYAKVESESDSTDRALYKWKRPEEFTPGWTRCFGIFVPPRTTQMPFGYIYKENKIVNFVKPPMIKQKVIFNILFSHKAARPEHLIRGSSHEITILGSIEMQREQAWLVSFYEKFTDEERAVITDHFKKLKIHLKPGSTGAEINYWFLHIMEEGIVPFLLDIELGKENLDIPDKLLSH